MVLKKIVPRLVVRVLYSLYSCVFVRVRMLVRVARLMRVGRGCYFRFKKVVCESEGF